MKNKDIFNIRKILENWVNKKGEISYYVMKNIELCDTLIKFFNNLKVVDNMDYKLQRQKIIKKYSSGIKDDQYIIDTNNQEDFNKEMDDLDYNFIKLSEIMNNECNINFYKIKKEKIPINLSAKEIKDISFMIE